MTMNNLFGARVTAVFCAFLLSSAMLLSAVGPAYNVGATQNLIA